MSHSKERKEKICLNCGADLYDRYCHKCGQENVEPKETFWHLVVHFFNDITHFDGKFFKSMKHLLTKPGFLTEEYIRGHRARHLNPIRMYIFISAVFFLLFANFNASEKKPAHTEKKKDRKGLTSTFFKSAGNYFERLDTTHFEDENNLIFLTNGDSVTERELIQFEPRNIQAYDSFQNLLPPESKDPSVAQYFMHKSIKLISEKNKGEARRQLVAEFAHALPYLMFISLPVITLMLQLLYIRRKQYYYVSHAIFIIHYFCFLFMAMLLLMGLRRLGTWGNLVSWVVQIGCYIYLYKAMLNFYKQGWFKTLVKFLILYSLSIVFFIVLFAMSLLVLV